MELLIAFSILNLIGFKFENVIWLSIVIAIIDILPILGVGTVLIPWFIWSFITGETALGIALLIVYLVILVIRQFIEPKLVSDQLGIHPIITLIAMYAGFKLVGFSGLILGPIALAVLRCVYADQIKKGLFKSLVE
jgi:predicted PurR-regulated permease PerM